MMTEVESESSSVSESNEESEENAIMIEDDEDEDELKVAKSRLETVQSFINRYSTINGLMSRNLYDK